MAILESISKAQTNLTAGTDEVVVLVGEIEKLNTAIWQYGLHNLSEEVLGYTTRLREDYAYKEASAKSFEGYKREAEQVDAEMLKRLLETAIENLGQNPIRIYDGHDNHGSPVQELLEKATKDDRWLDVVKSLLSRDKK